MNRTIKSISRIARSLPLLVGTYAIAGVAFAQTTTCTQPTGSVIANPLAACSIQQLIGEILTYVVQIGSVLLVLMLIYVGFQFVAARGNEEAISKARGALLWTVIGGLLLLGAAALATVIVNTVTSL